jgi:hypothetical protein
MPFAAMALAAAWSLRAMSFGSHDGILFLPDLAVR